MTGGPTGITGRQPQAIRTALAVLRAVARAGPGITARQISTELDLPPATTYRVLNLLVGEEYLVRLPDLRGFALGARLAELVGMSIEQNADGQVTSVVADLRASTGLAVTIATYTDDSAKIVVCDPRRPVPADDLAIGNLHASAIGRLLLASSPIWRDLLAKPTLNRLTPKTIVDPDRLGTELARIRNDEHAVQIEEVHLGLACIAVPINDGAGRLRAGLTVSAGAAVVERGLVGLVTQLRAAAADLRPLLPRLERPAVREFSFGVRAPQ